MSMQSMVRDMASSLQPSVLAEITISLAPCLGTAALGPHSILRSGRALAWPRSPQPESGQLLQPALLLPAREGGTAKRVSVEVCDSYDAMADLYASLNLEALDHDTSARNQAE